MGQMAQNNNYSIPMAGSDQPPPAYSPENYQTKYSPYPEPNQYNSNQGYSNQSYNNTAFNSNNNSQPINTQPVITTRTTHVTVPGVRCSSCNQNTIPVVTSSPNTCTWVSCCCLCFFLPLFCWIPFVCPGCQDQESKCPRCGHKFADL